MSKKYTQFSQLTKEELDKLLDYYANHTISSTLRQFSLAPTARTKLLAFLELNQIEVHSAAENETLKHMEKDGFDKLSFEDCKNIAEYYKTHSMTCTCEDLKVKEYFVRRQLLYFQVKPHTVQEEIDLTRNQKSGFAFSKTKEEKAQLELEKYGKLGLTNSEKVKQTNLKKYGVENTFAVEKFKQKAAQTKKERYGDEHFTNRAKAKETCQATYGAETYLGSDIGRKNIIASNQKNYGADYAFLSDTWQNNPEYKLKRKESKIKNKYNLDNYSEEYLNATKDKETFEAFIDNKTIFEIATSLGVTRDHVYYLLSKYDLLDKIKKQFLGTSHFEQELVDFIDADLCELHNRTVLQGKELDIFIPSKKLAIEFNGTRWHSTEMNKDRLYHFNKSKQAEMQGIRLIHIWEYEWEDPTQQAKIKMLLNIALGKVNTKIYARQCEIRKISNKEASILNNAIHLQGHRNAEVTYGLFYQDKLVQLMSFSRTKYNKNNKNDNCWEIIRGCPGSNNIVIGGVSKLFTQFIREYQPEQVFSYCDFNKFNGKSYEALGMQFIGYTGPDMKWVLKTGQVVNRSPKKHSELKEQAVAQIFGAGSKKYLWKTKK